MGNLRVKPLLQKKTITNGKQKTNYAISSMCGWRQYMQDAHLVQHQLLGDDFMSLFAIFDGHGGPQVSQFAQHHFLNCLLENGYFITKNYQRALQEAFMLLDSLMQAQAGNKQLKKILDQNVKKNNAIIYGGQCVAGSTANVVLLTKDSIYCANAGDTRAIAIMRESKPSKPKFKQLSIDHKPDQQFQRKRILKAGGSISDGRINKNLNLSRALGDFAYKKNNNLNRQQQIVIAFPDIVKVPRKDVSYILMGCDGIWQTKSCQKMTKWVHKKLQNNQNDLGKTLQNLFDEQVGKNPDSQVGMDNMTAILIKIKL